MPKRRLERKSASSVFTRKQNYRREVAQEISDPPNGDIVGQQLGESVAPGRIFGASFSHMQDLTSANFGLLIAYVLPGFVLLTFLGRQSPAVGTWLEQGSELSVAGFLYTTVASVAVGMVLSAVRWLIVDSFHHATGITKRNWDFKHLQTNISAFKSLVESQYRYYQFYANSWMALAVIVLYRIGDRATPVGLVDLILIAVMVVLFIASRDTLAKYYARVDDILSEDTGNS